MDDVEKTATDLLIGGMVLSILWSMLILGLSQCTPSSNPNPVQQELNICEE